MSAKNEADVATEAAGSESAAATTTAPGGNQTKPKATNGDKQMEKFKLDENEHNTHVLDRPPENIFHCRCCLLHVITPADAVVVFDDRGRNAGGWQPQPSNSDGGSSASALFASATAKRR